MTWQNVNLSWEVERINWVSLNWSLYRSNVNCFSLTAAGYSNVYVVTEYTDVRYVLLCLALLQWLKLELDLADRFGAINHQKRSRPTWGASSVFICLRFILVLLGRPLSWSENVYIYQKTVWSLCSLGCHSSRSGMLLEISFSIPSVSL